MTEHPLAMVRRGRAAWQAAGLTMAQQHALLAVVLRHGPAGTCPVGLRVLAADADRSPGSMQEQLRELQTAGWLEVTTDPFDPRRSHRRAVLDAREAADLARGSDPRAARGSDPRAGDVADPRAARGSDPRAARGSRAARVVHKEHTYTGGGALEPAAASDGIAPEQADNVRALRAEVFGTGRSEHPAAGRMSEARARELREQLQARLDSAPPGSA